MGRFWAAWEVRLGAALGALSLAAVAVPERPEVAGVLWAPAVIIGALAVLGVRRALAAEGTARWFWKLNLVALGLFELYHVMKMVSALGFGGPRLDSVALVPQTAGVGVMVLATLRVPVGLAGRAERIAFGLDLATLLTAAGVLLWHFFGTGALTAMLGGTATPNTGPLVGAGLVGTLIIAKAALASAEVIPRRSLYAYGVAAIVGGFGSGVATLLAGIVDLRLLQVVGALAELACVVAARFQVVNTPAAPGHRRRYSVLPYVAGLGVSMLLIWTNLRGEPDRTVVAVATVLTLVLIATRQLIAFRENELREQQFRLLVQNSTDITVISDPDGTIRYVSPAMLRVLGHPPEHMLGRTTSDMVHPGDMPVFLAAMARIDEPGAAVTYEVNATHADGRPRRLEITVSNLVHEPSIRGRVANCRDITETHEVQDRLRHEATHDSLTGLPNRVLFHERATAGLARAGHRLSLVLVDLDDFKMVNDTLGHAAGDALLITVAERMRQSVRAGDTVARLGGDEFALLIEDLAPDRVERLLTRIAERLRTPVVVDGHPLEVRASFGVVAGTDDADAGDLLRRADIAMYQAKARGDGGFQRYLPEATTA